MNRLLPILLIGLLTMLSGCSMDPKDNNPEHIAAIPYTFSGQSEDNLWQIKLDIRDINDADLAHLGELPDKVEDEQLSEGWRSVLAIGYQGEALLEEIEFTMGDGTAWVLTGSQKMATTAEEFTALFDLSTDLGGLFYSKDGYIGGPIPPLDEQFEFEIEAKTVDGQRLKADFMVAVDI